LHDALPILKALGAFSSRGARALADLSVGDAGAGVDVFAAPYVVAPHRVGRRHGVVPGFGQAPVWVGEPVAQGGVAGVAVGGGGAVYVATLGVPLTAGAARLRPVDAPEAPGVVVGVGVGAPPALLVEGAAARTQDDVVAA